MNFLFPSKVMLQIAYTMSAQIKNFSYSPVMKILTINLVLNTLCS